MVKRILIRILAVLVLLAAITYAVDYLSLRFKIPPGRVQFGIVTVQPYYEIHEKNNKVGYDFSPPAEEDSCVNSIFPHFGYPPCWYLRRHVDKKIEM
jgi:hypothetical protein